MTIQRRTWFGLVLLTAALCIPWATTRAQMVKIHVSSKAGDRLSPKPDMQFTDAKLAEGSRFEVNDAVEYQKIDGFGASIMEAGLITLNTLPADKQEEVLRTLFDAEEGAGYTAMKTPIAGTDFQLAADGVVRGYVAAARPPPTHDGAAPAAGPVADPPDESRDLDGAFGGLARTPGRADSSGVALVGSGLLVRGLPQSSNREGTVPRSTGWLVAAGLSVALLVAGVVVALVHGHPWAPAS